jgi:predicted transcriptional regulator of viral defense system
MAADSSGRVLALADELGLVRPRDLTARGIPAVYLHRLHERGLLERVARGVYARPGAAASEHRSLAEACKRVPRGVVCLLSALRFHGMTTQSPFEVWLAVGPHDRLPRPDYPPLRVVRFGGSALTDGVEEHAIDRVPVRLTTPARTVADCFKYRNKIGLDVALEALKDCLARRLATPDELHQAATRRGVAGVLRPYLEASV